MLEKKQYTSASAAPGKFLLEPFIFFGIVKYSSPWN
jgi:hypothetical protein